MEDEVASLRAYVVELTEQLKARDQKIERLQNDLNLVLEMMVEDVENVFHLDNVEDVPASADFKIDDDALDELTPNARARRARIRVKELIAEMKNEKVGNEDEDKLAEEKLENTIADHLFAEYIENEETAVHKFAAREAFKPTLKQLRDKPEMYYKNINGQGHRDQLHDYWFMMLKDTPYTIGEQTLMDRTSLEDIRRARGEADPET